jgi:leucyl aminopeptidase
LILSLLLDTIALDSEERMQNVFISRLSKKDSIDTLIVPVFSLGKKAVVSSKLLPWIQSCLELITGVGDFSAAAEEVAVAYPTGAPVKRVLFLGLGEKKNISDTLVRRVFSVAVKYSKKKRWQRLAFFLPGGVSFSAAFEGAELAGQSLDALGREGSDGSFQFSQFFWLGISKKDQSLARDLSTVHDAVFLAKKLVVGNASIITPQYLSQLALSLQSSSVSVKMLDVKALEKEKMGLLLAVGQGALSPPALIVIEYVGDLQSKDSVAIVGKGITYDTGGLSIKTAQGMETMKTDMAGAAAVLAAVKAAAALGVKQNIIAVIAAAENAIGPASYKPGDVFVSHKGLTVEVNNTDAEGRLVLADALSYIQKYYKVKAIVDLATLTGGIVAAIGEEASGLFCNDDKLQRSLLAAAGQVDEKLWPMPLYAEYSQTLKSQIADMKNSSGPKASACKGAAFLQAFIQAEMPWAHIDIAGTALLSEAKGYHDGCVTGVGVRLLVRWLSQL